MGKKNKESLGRALIKDRFSKNRHRKHVEDNTMVNINQYLGYHLLFSIIFHITELYRQFTVLTNSFTL
jgi:hypothetical protein